MKQTSSALVLLAAMLLSEMSGAATAARESEPVQGAQTRIAACTLLTKDEVKKIVPWEAMFDQMPIEEEPIGASGSSCNYPSVTIQVLPYTSRFFDEARKLGKLEAMSGVGDEAYFFVTPQGYADLYARSGPRIVTVQATPSRGQKPEALKPAVTALAKALIAKLR